VQTEKYAADQTKDFFFFLDHFKGSFCPCCKPHLFLQRCFCIE